MYWREGRELRHADSRPGDGALTYRRVGETVTASFRVPHTTDASRGRFVVDCGGAGGNAVRSFQVVRHPPFDPVSVRAISPTEWWVLGDNAIAHTTDAGAHFTKIPVPLRTLRVGHIGLIQLQFADASDGYLYGKRLFATHDGGHSWRRIRLGGRVSTMTASGGTVYATVGGYRHSAIMRSVAGSDSWAMLPTPGRVANVDSVDGTDLFVTTLFKHRRGERLLVSRDGGATWQIEHLPIEDLACDVHQVRPPVLWEHCATGMMSAIWRSTDNGATFTAPAKEGHGVATNAASFAAASNRVAVLAFQDIRRTADAGRSWHRVGPKPSQRTWQSFDFPDTEHGVGLRWASRGTQSNQLWATSDAGATWHKVHIPRGL